MASITTRKNADGTIGHRFRVRLQGHTYTETFLCTAEKKGRCKNAGCSGGQDGDRWATAKKREIQMGTALVDASFTVGDVIKDLKKGIAKKHADSNQRKQEERYDWWDSRIGKLKWHLVTPTIIGKEKRGLADGTTSPSGEELADGTINRYLSAFSNVAKHAASEFQWPGANPVKGVGRGVESDGRERWLTKDERDKLLAAALESRSKRCYLWTLAGMKTGARAGELARLTWRDVELDATPPRMTFRWTKSSRKGKKVISRTIPIHSDLVEVLRKIKKADVVSTLVFGKYPRGAYELAVERAELGIDKNGEGVCFHTLRHTLATEMGKAGASPLQLQSFFGWETASMVDTYVHGREEISLGAVNVLEMVG